MVIKSNSLVGESVLIKGKRSTIIKSLGLLKKICCIKFSKQSDSLPIIGGLKTNCSFG